jgi:GNAT superfamily N-acetyltransferase
VKYSKEFVMLDKSVHDRVSFDCGEPELNDFIQKNAARNMEAGISTTKVLPASKPLSNGKYKICAFYSVSPSSIKRETLPETYRKRLPYYPIPVFLIGQMAVHSECQGTGLGKITLINALEYLWNINDMIRANAVIVDCLNESVEPFYLQYGFKELDYEGSRKRLFLPMGTIESLFA